MERSFTINIPYQAGASNFALKGIPVSGRRGPLYLKKILGTLTLVLLSAAASSAVTGRRQWEAINLLRISPKQGEPLVNNLSGFNIREFQRALTGRPAPDAADIAANSNTTNTQTMRFILNFADDRFERADEQGVPMAFLGDGAIGVNWQSTGYFGTGQTIQTTTGLDLTFTYDEEIDSHRAGARVVYEAVGVSKLLADAIPGGSVTDMLLSQVDGSSTFSANSFAQISLDQDGDPIHNQTVPDRIIQAANESTITDTAGEYVYTSGTNPDTIPLVWPRKSSSGMGDVAIADNRFGFNGFKGSSPPTLTNIVYLLRRILPVDEGDTARQVAAVTGIPEGTVRVGINAASALAPDKAHGVIKVDTADMVPLHGVKGAVFGRFLPRTVNPVALRAVSDAAVKSAHT